MADLVNLTIDGRAVKAPPRTLVIDAAKTVGIEIPAFCYYEGLTLPAACRMCLVEVEKMPKMMTACTLPVAEGMVVRTETEQVKQARKYTLEFLLTNHPLDCPVCDKGGECELQDMVFRYGAGESRYTEEKVHTPEKQFSPVVFFDAPRCILCFRCVRVCNEGMGVGALGVVNRGVVSEIAPNVGDHLECDECGACIDICPVGALTSGTYRYQTRPWEMAHVGTICTHCGDGCKTTLGTRNDEIIRGNNRDRSGINGEFLCIKGRYAFDFYDHPERLQSPLMRVNGKLEEVSWAQALASRGAEVQRRRRPRGGSFGVIGSNHTTNEENFYLQKFARQVLETNNIDHHRTGDVVTLLDALSGKTAKLATVGDLYERKAVLVLGADLALEHPLLCYPDPRQLPASSGARLRGHAAKPVREDKYAAADRRAAATIESLRDKLKAEPELVILFGDSYQGDDLRKLVDFAESLGIPVKYVCLRGLRQFARRGRYGADAGTAARLQTQRPGRHAPGRNARRRRWTCCGWSARIPSRAALHAQGRLPRGAGHVPHRDRAAGRRRPAGGLRVRKERHGHQHHRRSAAPHARHQHHGRQAGPRNHGLHRARNGRGGGARPLGRRNGLRGDPPDVRGYDVPMPVIATGGAAQTMPVNGRIPVEARPDLVQSDHNGLFASGTLGRYSKVLNSVVENRLSR